LRLFIHAKKYSPALESHAEFEKSDIVSLANYSMIGTLRRSRWHFPVFEPAAFLKARPRL
jgi:hypothetical protein